MFCDMNVDIAMEKAVTGRKANPSAFIYAPIPAIAADENEFI